MFNLFKTKAVLDEESIEWLFDTFLWAEKNLDAETFYQQTSLIKPDNEFFPAHGHGIEDMTQKIFDLVKKYTHLQHWPCTLIEQSSCQLDKPSLPYIEGDTRGKKVIDQSATEGTSFPIIYHPLQVKSPEALIGYFAQTLAYYLLLVAPNRPDDIEENLAPLSEVIGVFMGFGVILANTAFNYKNSSCGSCSTPSMDRNSYLSQYDITYALAIFCVVKGIDKKEALNSLKGNLKPYFKKAYKDVLGRDELKMFSNSSII